SGFRNFSLSAWVSVLAPRNTPMDIVNRLNAAINNALAQPDLRERLIADGADIDPMSPEQVGTFIRSEAPEYQSVMTDEFCSRFGYGGCAGYNVYELGATSRSPPQQLSPLWNISPPAPL